MTVLTLAVDAIATSSVYKNTQEHADNPEKVCPEIDTDLKQILQGTHDNIVGFVQKHELLLAF